MEHLKEHGLEIFGQGYRVVSLKKGEDTRLVEDLPLTLVAHCNEVADLAQQVWLKHRELTADSEAMAAVEWTYYMSLPPMTTKQLFADIKQRFNLDVAK